MKTLVIARHGNTFAPGETPRRVGRRTDLPLVDKGREQAVDIGRYLRENSLVPDLAYSGSLRRVSETARLALAEAGPSLEAQLTEKLDEIDYGPDEGEIEEAVRARLGDAALEAWERDGDMPSGWSPRPGAIIAGWRELAAALPPGSCTLAVTSNGIARFAPHLTGDFESFKNTWPLKLATGALGILTQEGNRPWHVAGWNIRP